MNWNSEQFKAHLKEQMCKNHQENLEREVLHRTWPHCKDALQQRCQRQQAGTPAHLPATVHTTRFHWRSFYTRPKKYRTRGMATLSPQAKQSLHVYRHVPFVYKAFTDTWNWVGKGSCTCKPKWWFTCDQGWSLVWGPSTVSSANDNNII